MIPKFKHDCDKCVYLGTYTGSGHAPHDCYYCANPRHPSLSSLICRYGDEGSDYTSTHRPEAFNGPDQYLSILGAASLFCLVQAIRKGFVKYPVENAP